MRADELPATARFGRAAAVGLAGLLAIGTVAVFTENVARYWFLSDDAFISFRYAYNLSVGEGLVWNAGERVEGYTNFLWVLMMAAGMSLGVGPEALSCALGVASGAGVLGVLVWFSAGRIGWLNPLIWLAPFTLASSRSFAAWCSGGLGTQWFALLVLLANARLVAERDDDTRSPVLSGFVFSLATLARPEGAMFTGIAGLLFALDVLRGHRRPRALVLWALPWVLVVGTHVLWRFAYYGFWVPNTFYAKVGGVWLEQGQHYLRLFNDDYQIIWFLPLALLAVAMVRRFEHVLFALAVVAQSAYLLVIGGDRFEFRFLVVVLPYLYWLIADGARWLVSQGIVGGPARYPLVATGAIAAVALVVATDSGSARPEARRGRHHVNSIEGISAYAQRRSEEGRFLAQSVREGRLPADLMISVGGAGALPYYTRWPTLDYRGLNDLVVARTPIAKRGIIGHEHFATRNYMRERGVVVFDVLNRLVVDGDPLRFRGQTRVKDGQTWDLHAVSLGSRAMVFATPLPEEELKQRLGGAELLY